MAIKKFIEYIREYQHSWTNISEYHLKDDNIVTSTSRYNNEYVYIIVKKGELYYIDLFADKVDYDKINKIKDVISITYDDISNIDDLSAYLKYIKQFPDIMVFNIIYSDYNRNYTMCIDSKYHDLNYNNVFYKVLKFIKSKGLDISVVVFNGIEKTLDDTISDISNNIKSNITNINLYHGTSVDYLKGIMKSGLKSSTDKATYKKTQHGSFVFLTKDINIASDFSTKNVLSNNNTFGIILEIQSKDINTEKIHFDFDYYKMLVKSGTIKEFDDMEHYGNGGDLADKNGEYILKNCTKLAYKGIIYPSIIKFIYILLENTSSKILYKIPISDISVIYDLYDYCINNIRYKNLYESSIPKEELEKIKKYKVS